MTQVAGKQSTHLLFITLQFAGVSFRFSHGAIARQNHTIGKCLPVTLCPPLPVHTQVALTLQPLVLAELPSTIMEQNCSVISGKRMFNSWVKSFAL